MICQFKNCINKATKIYFGRPLCKLHLWVCQGRLLEKSKEVSNEPKL
jgi:hypothetical protein